MNYDKDGQVFSRGLFLTREGCAGFLGISNRSVGVSPRIYKPCCNAYIQRVNRVGFGSNFYNQKYLLIIATSATSRK